MDALLLLVSIVAGLGVFGLAAVRMGADSRPGFEDPLGRDIAI